MDVKVTRQFSSHAEIFCAQFETLDDGLLFIKQCMLLDKEKSENPVYWLFVDDKLSDSISNQSNPKKLQSRFASLKDELPHQILNPFDIKTMINSSEITIARFNSYPDAKLFATAKLRSAEDNTSFYCILDGDKLIERLDKATCQGSPAGEKKKVFRPTPLPNKPRLGPGSYWVDEDDNNND